MKNIPIKITGINEKISSYNEKLLKTLEDLSALDNITDDETFKTIKKVKASVKKEQAIIKNEKNKIKEVISDEIDTQIQENTQNIENMVSKLDDLLTTYNKTYENQKLMEIDKMFKKVNTFDWLNLDQIFDQKWLNRTTTLKMIENEVITKIDIITDDFKLIKIGEVDDYIQTLDIETILRNRLKNEPKREITVKIKINEYDFPDLKRALMPFEWVISE